MPVQSILDWLDLLRDQASEYGVDVKISPRETFQFRFLNEEGADCVGKVRYSASHNREWEDDDGTEHIWQRFDRELERIDAESEDRVVAIQLDVRSKEAFDSEQDQFLVIPEDILQEATSENGNIKIAIPGPGQYEEPFNGRANNWHDLFAYATGASPTSRPEPVSPRSPYYWVNQGEEEIKGEYLRAPTEEKYQYDLPKLEEGDIVFSYHEGEIVGFHEVWNPARVVELRAKDVDLTTKEENSVKGPEDTVKRYRVETKFRPFEESLAFADVFAYLQREDVRLDQYYPVNPGGINQRYLFNLSQEAGDHLFHLTGALQDHYDLLKNTVQSPLTPLLDPSDLKFEPPNHLFYPAGDRPRLAHEITAALNSGKHLILTGPPGTGKSDIATAIAETAIDQTAEVKDFVFTTATDSWTTFDTIGGYVPNRDSPGGQLDFDPRLFLSCFRDKETDEIKNDWLVIDELNRANIDDALGQLFSVLSKDAVELSYERDEPIRIEWVDRDTPPEQQAEIIRSRDRYPVTPSWRLVATMNTKDKSSLYDLSFAFMRRFAFVYVPVPSLRTEEGIIKRSLLDPEDGPNYSTTWTDKDDSLKAVIKKYHEEVSIIWAVVNGYREIGPAIVEDVFQHLASYPGGDQDAPLTSAITIYIFPQLEGLRRSDQEELLEELTDAHEIVGPDESAMEVELRIDLDVLERQGQDRFGLPDLNLTGM